MLLLLPSSRLRALGGSVRSLPSELVDDGYVLRFGID